MAARRLAWTLAGVSLGLVLAGIPLGLLTRDHAALPGLMQFSWFEASLPIQTLAWSVVGALIVAHQPSNRVGWLACLTGLLGSLWLVSQSYAAYGLFVRPGSLPAAQWMGWVRGWSWYPLFCLFLIWIPLLLPDGTLPSARWSWLLWATAPAVALNLALVTVASDRLFGTPSVVPTAPLPGALVNAAEAVVGIFLLGGGAFAAVGLLQRYRRSSALVRRQLKWFLGAGSVLIVVFLVGLPLALATGTAAYRVPVIDVLAPLALACLPISVWIAVVRHRLYDVDLVISRTALYAILAVLITAIYLLLVVGVGLLVGTGGRPNLVLSIVATAVVALAFQPLRARTQQVVTRLVYGRRLGPDEVLAELSLRVGRATSPDEVLATIAEVAAKAVAVEHARVSHRLPSGRERVVDWPSGTEKPFVEAVDIVQETQAVGKLEISRELSRSDRKLLEAIARQAALALRNLRLSEELADRLEQIEDQAKALAASRARIVHAQENERRRIERDIHDGAQQQLIALIAKLGLAGNQLRRDARVAAATLQEAQEEARQALVDLRELARGIHPAVLSSKGLLDAIETVAARMPIGVRVEADPAIRGLRYEEEIEGAAYFVACEGLVNVLKHASASQATVRISENGEDLAIRVSDDGVGIGSGSVRESGLRGLRDRLDALGGTLRISGNGTGTRLEATLPARRRNAGSGE